MARRLKNTGKTVFVCPSVMGGKLMEATIFEDTRTGMLYAYRIPQGASVDLFVLLHKKERAKVIETLAQPKKQIQTAVSV